MSKKVKIEKQSILLLDQIIRPKISTKCNEEILIVLKHLHFNHQLVFGANSIYKGLIDGRISVVIFPSYSNECDFLNPILSFVKDNKIPVINLKCSEDDIVQQFGLKKSSVLGILEPLPNEIKQYFEYLESSCSLRRVVVEVDKLVEKLPRSDNSLP